MHELNGTTRAVTHQLYAMLRRRAPREADDAVVAPYGVAVRDRGAVSLEQVLWYVAAGVAVAVIAGILWNQIRDQATTPVVPPSAPSP